VVDACALNELCVLFGNVALVCLLSRMLLEDLEAWDIGYERVLIFDMLKDKTSVV